MSSLRRLCTALILSLFVLFVGLQASGQPQSASTPAEPASGFGTVSGHVYFAGGNAPARLVNIALQPMDVQLEPPPPAGRRPALGFTIYQTGLDGSYTIPHVPPGNYYVVVNEPGFLSPFVEFTPEQLANPTPQIAQQIALALPVVSVRPNATATMDLTLQRGAGLSGTIRFDDGTPYVAAAVSVQRRDEEGKWVSTSSYSGRPVADADGRWEASGLPAGEYRVRITLSINDRKQSSLVGNSSSSSGYDRYSLSFYSGDTARERDEKTIKLQDGEQNTTADVTIPVSKLHSVSGAVVDAGTGQALNAGHVELYYADDNSYAVGADIDPDTRSFTFNFVPEGQYTLRVSNPREVRWEAPPPDTDPNFPELNRKAVTLRQYAPSELPLTLQTDTTAVNVPVQPRSAAAQ